MKKIIVEGRIVSDLKVNDYRSNGKVCKEFSLLIIEEVFVQGVPEDRTEFVTCRCYARDEKEFEKNFGILRKDERVHIEGVPLVEAWKKDDQVQSRLVVGFEKFKPIEA